MDYVILKQIDKICGDALPKTEKKPQLVCLDDGVQDELLQEKENSRIRQQKTSAWRKGRGSPNRKRAFLAVL